jgi:hypothetical protein
MTPFIYKVISNKMFLKHKSGNILPIILIPIRNIHIVYVFCEFEKNNCN